MPSFRTIASVSPDYFGLGWSFALYKSSRPACFLPFRAVSCEVSFVVFSDETGQAVVFAASSGVERASWVAAVMGQLSALQAPLPPLLRSSRPLSLPSSSPPSSLAPPCLGSQEGNEAASTPLKGWLMKQGGRKGGRKWGWRKRWFVLPPEGNCLAYYTSAGRPSAPLLNPTRPLPCLPPPLPSAPLPSLLRDSESESGCTDAPRPKVVIPLVHPADVFRLPEQHVKVR